MEDEIGRVGQAQGQEEPQSAQKDKEKSAATSPLAQDTDQSQKQRQHPHVAHVLAEGLPAKDLAQVLAESGQQRIQDQVRSEGEGDRFPVGQPPTADGETRELIAGQKLNCGQGYANTNGQDVNEQVASKGFRRSQ